MILSSTPFSRRRVLSAVALAPLAATAAPRANFDPDDPGALLDGFRRLRFSLRSEPVFWWLRVSKHGVVNGELTHLYDMEVGSIFQARELEDGFSVTSLELIYTVDPQSGELIDELTNPYTGERLPWTHTPVGPATVNYSSSGMELPSELPGVKIEMTHGLASGMLHAGQVWLKDDNSAVVTQLQGDEPPFLVADWSTYLGQVADLEDPELASAPATVAFQSTTSWQKPMRMGRRPGSMISRGAGAKADTYGDLPARHRELIEQVHPDIAADPTAALRKNPYRFEK
jgi:hypothetical protein